MATERKTSRRGKRTKQNLPKTEKEKPEATRTSSPKVTIILPVLTFLILFLIIIIMLVSSHRSHYSLLPQKETPVWKAIKNFQLAKKFSGKPVEYKAISSLLRAGYGEISRPTPPNKSVISPDKSFKLKLFLFAGKKAIKDLDQGVYRFIPEDDNLEKIEEKNRLNLLIDALGNKKVFKKCKVFIVLGVSDDKLKSKKSALFAGIEAGSVLQNLLLISYELNIKLFPVFKFKNNIKTLLPDEVEPILVIGVGK